jgi:beta-lactam-binding protein with PASTA domain
MRNTGLSSNRLGSLFAVLVILLLGGPEKALAQARSGFPMPNVIGLTETEAERRVVSAGKAYGATSAQAVVQARRPDSRPAGRIIQQLEAPGTPMFPYRDDVGGVYGQVAFRVVVSTGPRIPSTFPMPNVVGMTVPEAERRVLAAGRETRASSARAVIAGRQSDELPAGRIIRQLEAPRTAMRPFMGDVGGNYGEVSFRVVVSTGPEPAPNFVGSSLNEAERLARRREVALNVGPAQRNPRVPQGIVVRQDPAAGQPMQRRRVTVYPSAGYPLPDYVGQPVERARNESRRLEFSLEESSEENVDFQRGVIFDQEPEAGTPLPLRGPVTVRVSRGWPVPEFIGRTETEAGRIAEETRIRLNATSRENPRVPAGIIFDQRPPAGDLLPRDRTVSVAFSTGYPLPDLIGMHQDEARRVASELNFELAVRRSPLVDRIVDHVDGQNPGPGTRLPLDGPVNLLVSEGWPTPEFLTLGENEATALAAESQVTLQVVERRRDRESRPGIVIEQSPPPGALLPPGQAVGVVFSASDPTPRLIGLTEEEAAALAAREDIRLNATGEPSREFAPGLIAGQSPEPGDPLPADGTVSAVVSTGWPTPDFVGMTEAEANSVATDIDIALVKTAPREDFELSSGRVIEQRPAAGAVIPADRRVEIALSLGWPVAPDAVGRSADSAEREFLGRHSSAFVEHGESLMTLEPAGIVISQHPEPGVKLGPKQRLRLVSSAAKPPWLWPAGGVASILLALAVFAGLKAAFSPSTPESVSTEDPGGVRLRVTKDHGVQAIAIEDGGDRERAQTEEIVKIRVNVDLGEQSAGPIDDKGDET